MPSLFVSIFEARDPATGLVHDVTASPAASPGMTMMNGELSGVGRPTTFCGLPAKGLFRLDPEAAAHQRCEACRQGSSGRV